MIPSMRLAAAVLGVEEEEGTGGGREEAAEAERGGDGVAASADVARRRISWRRRGKEGGRERKTNRPGSLATAD